MVLLGAAIGLAAGAAQPIHAAAGEVRDHRTGSPAAQGRAARQPMVTDIKRDKLILAPAATLPLPPPPAPPEMTDGQIHIVDGIEKPLPSSIPSQGRPTTLVVAETLDLEGIYSFGSENLIIVADTVRLKGIATFDLAAGRPKAGDLTIIAQKYVTEEKGNLIFLNKGNDPNASPGRLLLVADNLELRSAHNLEARSNVSKQGGGTSFPRFAVEVQTGGVMRAGHLWIDKSINPQIPNGLYIVGYWVSYLLSTIAKDIQFTIPLAGEATASALASEKQEKLIQLVNKGQALIPTAMKLLSPKEAVDRGVFDSKKWVDSAMALLTLWTDELRLPSNNSVQVIYDGKARQAYLAPTNSLVRVVVNDDRRYLGYLDQHSQNPAQVLLSFDVKLSVDADIEQEVIETLGKRVGGFSYKGQFRDYEVTASDFAAELPEVKSANVTSSGDIVHVSLGLDPESAAITLTRLASGSGVPLRLKWTYRSNANVKGTWQIPISFARRDLIDVEMLAEGIRNSGKLAVTVEYVVLSDRSIFPLDPAVTLQPGGNKPIAIPKATDLSKVLIPPDAVFYHVAADPLREIFFRDSSIYDTVEITNLLGAHPQLGPLQYVELTVIYSYDPSEGTAAAKKGPFRLTARDATGSQQKVSFLRRRKGDRDIVITGVAVYESGSTQTLKPNTFHSLAAAIERDMLPAQ